MTILGPCPFNHTVIFKRKADFHAVSCTKTLATNYIDRTASESEMIRLLSETLVTYSGTDGDVDG